MQLEKQLWVLRGEIMIKIKTTGSFDRSIRFLNFLYRKDFLRSLNGYAEEGVAALSAATPVLTGKTAASWYYSIKTSRNSIKITWCNSNMADGTPIAILIQYGHGTKSGYYVQGRDYINPAIQPVFDNIAENVWREVTNA